MTWCNPKTVVVVSGRREFRIMMDGYLGSHGFQVVSAESAAAAIDFLHTDNPREALLLDVSDARADDRDLLDWLGGLDTLKRVPTIVIAGSGAKETVGDVHTIFLGAFREPIEILNAVNDAVFGEMPDPPY